MRLITRFCRVGCQTVLAFGVSAISLGAAEKPVVQSLEMQEDFSGNSLGQWASYPPVQDIGYDPSLSPTKDYGAPGGRSLMRIARPASPGVLNFGFIKKLDALAAGPVRFSFSYRLKPAEPGSTVEIAIAGGDGHRYVSEINVTSGKAWSPATVNFNEIPAGTSLQAISVTAHLRNADPDIDYRFLIDDITLSAARAARFTLVTPKGVVVEPWRPIVSTSTYSPGETLALSATAPVELSKASYTIKDQDGHSVKTGDLTLTNGAWSISSAYVVRQSDPTGVWHAEIRGTTADGQSVFTDLRFLVRPPRVSVHPRLFFSASEKATLSARTHDPRFASSWNNLVSLASESRNTGDLANGADMFALLDPVYLLPTWRGYMTTVGRASNRIENNALISYVADDAQAHEAAKKAMLEIASWNTWIPPWFEAHGQHTYYPAGELAADVSLAYDVLYDDLSPSERNVVKRALVEKGSKATYREYVLDNRLMANTSNWIGHTVGGAIVSTLAVFERDDDPELNIYLGGLLMKFEDHLAASYLSDGSYGEGISYQEFDLKTSGLALVALNRFLGIDYWSRTHVKDSLGYPLYALANPSHDTLDMGDSHGPTAYSVAPLVQHSSDPTTHWYYDQFGHRSISDFLFPPEPDQAAAPPNAVSRYFDQKGNVLFRTGWKPDDTVFLFRAGPNFNHNHGDQGAFLLRAFGEPLAVEGGYADYYNDPYYQTYFSQASGHNTVLVDGDPASQDIADTPQFLAFNHFPRITDVVTTEGYDSVGSELANVYKGRLKSYARRIAFLKPHYMVIFDDLATNQSPSTFEWLLHVNDRDHLHAQAQSAIFQGKNASMGIRALEPDTASIQVKNGYLPHSIFSTAAPKEVPAQPGILDISSGPSLNSTQFLVLLSLSRNPEEASGLSSKAQKISGGGCVGVRLDDNVILFRKRAFPMASCAGWRTDAEQWSAASLLVSGQLVTSLARDGKTLFLSDHKVTFVARQSQGSVELSIDAAQPSTVRYHLGFVPASSTNARYNPADGTIQLEVPTGHRQFIFAGRGSH